ncbi:MAG: hypothetical protein KAS32_05155 [Candidatus Peribacteraceae bacterium]|nr:hypothetical protein [Candidatus Peribacteraceae bacterium]
MPSEWYSPGDIRFWPEHVEWAITHLNELEDGRWPRDPAETGYTDAPGFRQGKNATFEVPVCLAAEITTRLDMCSTDGKLARKCLADGWDELTLAELMHTDHYRIRRRVHRVVLYCSGWRRKRISFNEFKRRHGIREYYRRNR